MRTFIIAPKTSSEWCPVYLVDACLVTRSALCRFTLVIQKPILCIALIRSICLMYVQYLSMASGRAHADAKRLFPRIRFPYLKKM